MTTQPTTTATTTTNAPAWSGILAAWGVILDWIESQGQEPETAEGEAANAA